MTVDTTEGTQANGWTTAPWTTWRYSSSWLQQMTNTEKMDGTNGNGRSRRRGVNPEPDEAQADNAGRNKKNGS
jgi:hypothetical protein